MKDSALHALNIGALALWLSVSGFAAVAIWVPSFIPMITFPGVEEATELCADFTIGDGMHEEPEAAGPSDALAKRDYEAGVPLPSPPRLPGRTTLAPLPEIPDSPSLGRAAASLSAAARLAAGHTPGPIYPAQAFLDRQSGTAVVQFTVDTSGRVGSVSIYSSSGWEMLDREALRTVRSWEYPPGDVLTMIRPIAFRIP